MTISGYAFTILTIINLKRNVIVVTIYIYVGTSLHVRSEHQLANSEQISLFTSHDNGYLQLQIKAS